MKEIMKIGKAIQWQEIEKYSNLAKNKDKVTLCFFGECGTGKSTDLSLISEIYRANHEDECARQSATFVSG